MTRCRAGLTIQEMDYGLAIQVEDKRCRAQNISQREKMCRRKLHGRYMCIILDFMDF